MAEAAAVALDSALEANYDRFGADPDQWMPISDMAKHFTLALALREAQLVAEADTRSGCLARPGQQAGVEVAEPPLLGSNLVHWLGSYAAHSHAAGSTRCSHRHHREAVATARRRWAVSQAHFGGGERAEEP